jgi:hypothetical protein
MKCIPVAETDKQTYKIVKIYYKAYCNICKYTVKSKDELSAKKAILAHIVSQHKEKWLNHQGELVDEK